MMNRLIDRINKSIDMIFSCLVINDDNVSLFKENINQVLDLTKHSLQ